MKKTIKRLGAGALAFVIATTTAFGMGIVLNNKEVKAAEKPETIKMPIVVYDHLNDHLLFEYALASNTGSKLSMYDESKGSTAGMGLVETELGENGMPVYKKSTVEDVAKNVKAYIESGDKVENALYNQIVSQITLPGDSIQVLTQKNTGEIESWSGVSGTTWRTSEYGGIRADIGETAVVYKEIPVETGRIYKFRAAWNEVVGGIATYTITAKDMNGNTLAQTSNSEYVSFEAANIDKIKLEVTRNNAQNTNNLARLANINLEKTPYVTLGDYEQSKKKYDEGSNLNGITSAMDYAYYMLNNFWADTNGDITQKTDLYKTITLNKNAQEKYTFTSGQEKGIVYDIENGNIYNAATGGVPGQGFYPLDSSVLGSNTDLKAPFGIADGEMKNPYDQGENKNHNYHYAMKAHCEFIYDATSNLAFTFSGDDDVYLFIDGKLALDIGGAHSSISRSVNVDELAQKYGLVDGEVYDFDFFYMERHTTDSNITITTNMILQQADAKPAVTYKDKNGNVIENGSKLTVGEKVNIEYSVEAGMNGMANVTFMDKSLDVVIGKDGIDLGNKGAVVEDEIVVTIYDKTGNVKETFSIAKDDLNDNDKVNAFTKKIGETTINKGEEMVVSGISKTLGYDSILSSELSVGITAPINQYDDNGQIVPVATTVSVVPVEILVVPTAQPKVAIDVEFTDSEGQTLTTSVSEGTEVGIKYTLEAQSEGMKNITIQDSALGFNIGSNGIELGSDVKVNNKLTLTIVDADGRTVKEVSLSKDKLSDINSKEYKDFIALLGSDAEGIVLNTGEKLVISGMTTEMVAGGISANPTAVTTGPSPAIDENTGNLVVNYTQATANTETELGAIAAYDVKYVVDADKAAVTGKTDYRVDEGKTTASQPTVTEKEGYTFTGWEKTTKTNTTPSVVEGEPKDAVITEDTTFTAKFTVNSYEYVVKYIDKDTKTELVNAKTLNGDFGTLVSASAEAITGYTPDAASKSITMKVSGNEIVFEYTINQYDVTFIAGNNGSLNGTANEQVKYNDTVSSVPTPEADTGYKFIGWEKTVNGVTTVVTDPSQEIIVADTTFTAKFGPENYSYEVKYVDESGNPLATSNFGDLVEFGTDVTEYPVDVTGYEPIKTSETITVGPTESEIVFVYKKKVYNVSFESDENGTLTGDTDQKVEYLDKVSSVPTESAKEGYTFTGWTMLKDGETTAISVQDPSTVEIDSDVVFVANYEANKYNYTIKYVDKNGKELSKEVTGSETFGKEITVFAVNIAGYNVNYASQKKIISTEGNVITFVYTKKAEESTTQDNDKKEDETTTKNDNSDSKNDKETTKNNSKIDSEETLDVEAESAKAANGLEGTGADMKNTATSPKTGELNSMTWIFMTFIFAFASLGGLLTVIRKRNKKISDLSV